jgi:hypothetical protein
MTKIRPLPGRFGATIRLYTLTPHGRRIVALIRDMTASETANVAATITFTRPGPLERTPNTLKLLSYLGIDEWRRADSVMGDFEIERAVVALLTAAHRDAKFPPVNGQFLLDLFLPNHLAENAIGDLQERYNKKLKRLGRKRADLWYWTQVWTSLWPFLKTGARRISQSTVLRAVCFVLRMVGQTTWADVLKKHLENEKKRIS